MEWRRLKVGKRVAVMPINHRRRAWAGRPAVVTALEDAPNPRERRAHVKYEDNGLVVVKRLGQLRELRT